MNYAIPEQMKEDFMALPVSAQEVAVLMCTRTTGEGVLKRLEEAENGTRKLAVLVAMCPTGPVDTDILLKCADFIQAAALKFIDALKDVEEEDG